MENPATWGLAEKIVNGVLRQDRERQARELTGQPPVVGLSLPRRITDALRAAGLLA